MADNLTLNAGSGGATLATDQNPGASLEHYQLIKLVHGALDSFTIVSTSSGLPVQQQGTWTATLVSTTNAGATVKTADYDTGAGVDTVTMFGIALPASGGAVAGGTSTNPVRTDPTGTTTQPVSGTVSIAANGPVNVAQINGVTPLMGNGVTGTGSQRVTIASDNSAFSVNAVESGTWTVQPGNTPNTSPWLMTQTPATSGGLSVHHLVSAATTNATNIKASAGQVFGWFIYNSNAAARKVAFHNTAGTPTAGASIFFAIVIPPTSGANVEFTNGIAFSTGIAITMVTDLTDAGATAVAANDLISNIFYK